MDSMSEVTKRRTTEKPYKKASSFLKALSPIFGELPREDWLYRGVGDTTMTLIPSVLRNGAPFFVKDKLMDGPLNTYGYQILGELETLNLFLMIADREGVRIPEDSQRFRGLLEDLRARIEGREEILHWPPSEALSALALAQHNGIPTRMLDWTLDAYTAAYFAARSAIKSRSKDGRLCVWVLWKDIVSYNPSMRKDGHTNNTESIRYVTVPLASNPNLRAQKGVFLIHQLFHVLPNDPVSLTEYTGLLFSQARYAKKSLDRVLYQFTLPKSQAPELLRLLSLEGVDAASLFPGPNGVAQQLFERAYYPT